ncbi:hypothetical protein GCM10022408_23680 [Hymenobacter fastidiosus]|uniref:Thioredoxin domain-containing protein n=2 Tax=Hymenobacter fastidiosus TaxID=486264 RepID=A0ABP7SEI1_9BACT
MWGRSAAYVLVPLLLYVMGRQTEVVGGAQRLLLTTGLFNPALTPAARLVPNKQADYSLPLLTLEGKPTSLGALRGKVVFLNLWATWCPPCVAEMPGIQHLYEQLKTEPKIAFVLLSLDQNPDKARRFVARRGFTMPAYTLNGNLPAAFETGSIPTTFIISPTGEIVARHEGMADYDRPEVARLLRRLQTAAVK